MDWDSLGPFIFFIIWMAASIFKAAKKKKQPRRPPAGEEPVIFDQPTEPKQPPIITAPMPQQEHPAEPHKTLDYMMAKPKEDKRDEAQVYRESEPQHTAAAEIPASAADVLAQVQDDYKNYLAQQRFAAEVKADAPEKELDYIQRTEIASEQAAKLRISIEKQQITQAITYAQVLEQPKSLQYLRRFGIRRVIHKD